MAIATLSDHEAVKQDIANFKAAIDKSHPTDAFMPAASPGVVSTFQPNRHYPTHAAYIGAVADAMQEEYEAIAGAGIVVQLDSPDLAMARHTGFQDLSEAEFVMQAEQQIEALNHALANVPAVPRGCICAGATTKARTISTSRCRRSCRSS